MRYKNITTSNELDRAVTKKQNDLKNDERWPELNSKLAELSRKKHFKALLREVVKMKNLSKIQVSRIN